VPTAVKNQKDQKANDTSKKAGVVNAASKRPK
jgi:hypothetical protein